MSNNTPNPVMLAEPVVYRDGHGLPKAAIVTGTPASIVDGGAIAAPAEGSAILTVFSASGAHYVRTVPEGQGPHSFARLEAGNDQLLAEVALAEAGAEAITADPDAE